MEKLALYCKSYSRDVYRVRRLLKSVERFNRDGLPFIISVPERDVPLFNEELGEGTHRILADEFITGASPGYRDGTMQRLGGSLSQQILKAEFWRLGIAECWLCVDSDSIFLRDFFQRDFIHPDGNPFTVIHENREFLQLATNLGHGKVKQGFAEESARFGRIFGREGPVYSFMPSPFLWSAKVWQDIERHYLKPNNTTIWEAITRELPESMWYGEALLAYQSIPIHPVEPYFRVYHYDWQYFWLRRQGETEARIAENFLGVIYQSNWDERLDYGAPRKPWPSRVVRATKRFFRWLAVRLR